MLYYVTNGGNMWVIFNPIDNEIRTTIEYPPGKKGAEWSLKPGETKKFPNEVGETLLMLYGYLQVLKKDEEKSTKIKVKEYTPPKNLDDVEEAVPEVVVEDRRIKHPSSNPSVIETGGFGEKRFEEEGNQAGGLKLKEKLQNGKLVQLDRDGIEWYGKGVEQDDPFRKE